ncbi:MAG TPA: phosphomannomutase/phosphoglucomutase [Propionibacteriaceae bacterium]|nr:phosphomannomutase/phosphoglucomutase [Propionibacteriaceae bacterium]HPZ49045.1 phosphomannomutase/phosphoglucomutase [Propionibacteriaceae bacterium]
MLHDQIFKANDIRGIVGSEWDERGAGAVGAAYVEVMALAGGTFVLGRDMRTSGPAMARAFAEGAMAAGASVVDAGLASTDELWFASGFLDLPGIQFTASHNPAAYNGIKFCLAQAQPVSADFLVAVAHRAREIDAGATPVLADARGSYYERDVLADYAGYLHSLVHLDGMRRLKVVVDAGNGMAGHTAPAVLGPLNVDMVGLYLELDGSFPNHQPNPLEPENLVDAQRAVVDHGADLALVFDGDADRCFVIDERGEVVSPSVITALIAAAELEREPGATIVVNTITSRTVAEVVTERGGQVVTSKVGHTYVKGLMAGHGAIFGGEHSAHYYFRDFWGADTGMLAGLHVLGLLGRSDRTMSQLAAEYDRYAASGEINSTVADVPAMLDRVERRFDGRGAADRVDGLTVRGDDWWVSLRPSNTEPLLRLNVEAKDPALMGQLRDEVLAIVREETA